MKTILKLIISISALALLGGCSGENPNGNVFGDSGDSAVQMEIGTDYNVSVGDKIVPDGNATIVVGHVLDRTTKTVQITSGSATLLTGDYAI